jgi:hypothetical protein
MWIRKFNAAPGEGLGGFVGSLKSLKRLDLVKWDACVKASPTNFEELLLSISLGEKGKLERELKEFLGAKGREERKFHICVKERLWDQDRFMILRAFHQAQWDSRSRIAFCFPALL